MQSAHPRWILTPGVNSVCLPLCLSSVMLCMWFTLSAVTLLTVQCLFIQTIAFTHVQPQTQCHTPVNLPVCVRRAWESQIQGLQGLRRTPDTLVCGITESQTESSSFFFLLYFCFCKLSVVVVIVVFVPIFLWVIATFLLFFLVSKATFQMHSFMVLTPLLGFVSSSCCYCSASIHTHTHTHTCFIASLAFSP